MSSSSVRFDSHDSNKNQNSLPIGDEAFNLSSLSKQASEDKQQIFSSLILPPSNLHPAALASQLNSFINHSTSTSSSGSGYIWNRESPQINLTKLKNGISISFRVSDAVEDEWFMTYILLNASIKYPGILIKVEDQDGQFLLIEAADSLPNWITPDNSENRVWIFNGELHLIDFKIFPLSKELDEEVAASLIRDPSKKTLASKEISENAFLRLKDYPLTASDNSQRSLVFLPKKVAKVLLGDPQLIAPITESICSRDAISSRAFQRMSNFPPLETSTPSSNLQPDPSTKEEILPALVSICLTRRIYAQLTAQRFFAPKAFGRRWQNAVESYRALLDTPISEDDLSEKELEERKRAREEGKWWDLGCKISCGLEMLYSEEKVLESRRARPVRPNEVRDPRNTESYDSFLSSLMRMGYFENEIQGSARWKQLEMEAVENWESLTLNQEKEVEEIEKQNANTGISKRIEAILSSSNDSNLLSIDPAQPLSTLAQYQDPDDWLSLSAEELEEMLSSNDRGGKGNSEEDLEQQTAEQLKSFASKMENFVNAQGDLEGARFDDEKSDEDEEDSDEDEGEDAMDLGLDENGDEEDDEMDIDEDPEGQARNKEQEEIEALKKAQIKLAELSTEERETATKKLISSLNNEEWGAKNAESAKRAANMAKKMAAEPSTSKQESDSMEVDSSQVEQEESSTEDQENTSAATLRGLGRNQHFDGDSDEEESLDGDDDTAEEKADRAAWLGLDEPNPESTENSSSNRKDSIASTTQGFDGEGAEMENTGEEDEESTMQTEMDGFLEFSRRALGLSDEHYAKILSERTARGAYTPGISQPSSSSKKSSDTSAASSKGFPSRSDALDLPEAMESLPASRQKLKPSPPSATPSVPSKGKSPLSSRSLSISTLEERERAKERADKTLAEAEESARKRKEDQRNLQQQQVPNPNINSFEQLMQAMESELGSERLRREKGGKGGAPFKPSINPSTANPSKPNSAPPTASNTRANKQPMAPLSRNQSSMMVDSDDSDSGEDELSAQDAELLKNLLSSNSEGSLASLANVGGGTDSKGNPNDDQINLISNFLESFKAQGGDAGPVGNLANRMGVRLPRDDGN